MNWNDVREALGDSRRVLIVVHENPDGDAWGSAFGLALVLAGQGYEPQIIRHREPVELYQFLPGQEWIKLVPKGPEELPAGVPVIALDCGDRKRIEYAVSPASKIINIDHHASNTGFGDVNLVDADSAATAELLYYILAEAGIPISPEAATCFYVALATDTGNFTHSNLTARALHAAGYLLEIGADLQLARDKLLDNRPKKELILIQEAMKNLRFSEGGEIAWSFLEYSAMEREDLITTETDNLLNIMRQVSGVELVILFREQEPDQVKVSFRTKAYINANLLAQKFSGGGHVRAAGASVQKPLTEVVSLVMGEAERSVKGRR
ncbi:MAG: bifunctional oligoribonuclease/PAP phosphatase NrnA [Peptococcaceae bacterium]|jgi:phosphoesterase RecJ-like protein|nr:bifunctional oligoribonuclease/PAP phosphatase NrnA [Peptococcaceae bacterium]